MSDGQDTIDVVVPNLGESVATAIISRWITAPGTAVSAGQPVLEVDSDKASMEVPAPAAGVVLEHLVAAGEEVAVGTVVARLRTGAPAAEAPAPAAEAPAPAASEPAARPATPSAKGPQAGPAARQAAHEHGVDLGAVQGSGVRGRVLSRDVAAAPAAAPASVEAPKLAPAAPAAEVATPAPKPTTATVERVPMSPLRRTIARRLVEGQQTAATLTTFNEVDLSAVMAWRKRFQDAFVERHGIKLGFMSFFVKAAVDALKAYPSVNAEIDGTDILFKYHYDIGVAVSSPRGLMVPVVRHADSLSFADTEKAIAELAGRARDNRLTPDDFQGGTFTISNGGVFGSLMSTPILNPPQVGILGMHAVQDRPVGVEGRIELRPMMYLALSYDHRIIDGREAVGFLKRIKDLVEAPERLLLEV